jgi:cobalt-zinc-cadmium efflux system outer membrane protein
MQAHVQFAAAVSAQTYGGPVVAEAQQVLEGARTSHPEGAASLLEVLNAQRSPDDVYVANMQALTDGANTTVALQLSIGAPPVL